MGDMQFIGLTMLLVYLGWGSAPSCACPPPLCSGYDEADPLRIFPFLSYVSVCISSTYSVDFPDVSLVTLPEGTTHAYYRDEDAVGCKDICVMTPTGEVCKGECVLRAHYDILTMDVLPLLNAVCTNEQFDACCPDLGPLCAISDTECVLPNCTPPKTEGCFQCQCFDISGSPGIAGQCPSPLEHCAIYHAYSCCANGSDCGMFGDQDFLFSYPTIVHPRFDECPEDPNSFLPCDGTLVSDENCCPIACVPGAPCDCNGLSDGNTDTWNIDIQRDNSQDPYDVAGSSGVDVGGRKRVFVSRADNSEFCISSLSISVECMTLVYIKIYQMQDGKPQPIAINENIAVPVASQTGVYTATFDYPDTLRRVVSFRLGFKKEKSAACAGKSSASNLVVQPCQAK